MATLDARAVGSATTSAPSAGAYLILGAGAVGYASAAGTAAAVVVAGVLVTQVGLGLDVGGTTPAAVTALGLGMDSQRIVPLVDTQVAANIDVLRVVPVDDTQVALGLDVDRIVPLAVTQLLLQIDALGRRNLTSTYCWEFHVYDRAGVYLTYLDNAYNKSYLSELNDCGGGQFSIHADDPKATSTNIAVGNLVTIRYANIDIGTWVMEDIDEVLVGDGENVDKIITVSGRGALGLLEDGIVYPSNTADPNTAERAFNGVPKAEIFLTLWDEFQARGGGDLTANFTKTTDTDGAAWADTATLSVKAGQTMLAVMRELAALGLDFTVSPDRTLSCRATEGSDKSSSVAFRHGHNIIGCQRKTMGANVTNAVLGEGQGVFIESTDATSISARGRREAYVAVRNTANSTQVGDANAIVINEYKDPPTSIQIAVLDNGVYPFLTYDLGDTVHVDIPGEVNADYRVLAITMKERTGPCDLAIVLELNSLEAEWLIRVNRALQASLQTVQAGAGSDAGVASTDASPTVTATGTGLGTASIRDYHIAWGTAVNYVSAGDIPIADAGGDYAGTTIEAALQELGAGSAIGFPWGAFASTATQTIAAATAAYAITYTDTLGAAGLTLSDSSRINVTDPGKYLITYSAVGKSAAPNKTLDIWLAVDGTPVANSNTSSKFVGSANERVITVTYIEALSAGQYFELYMHSDDTGTVLLAAPVASSPTRPASPSIITTVNKVSA